MNLLYSTDVSKNELSEKIYALIWWLESQQLDGVARLQEQVQIHVVLFTF